MKTAWNIISFLAVIHLLAIAIFVAWLWQSRRLNTERIESVRELFASPVHAKRPRPAAPAGQGPDRGASPAQALMTDGFAMDSHSQIDRANAMQLQQEQMTRRLQHEKNTLLAQLATVAASIEQQKEELARHREAWEHAVESDRQRKSDEQFLQTVRQYEQAPPKQGKKMIEELVTGNQVDTAVAYLDAMNPRSANRILREFKTDQEVALATRLLERLRTLGTPAPVPSTDRTPRAADAASPQDDSSDADGFARAQ